MNEEHLWKRLGITPLEIGGEQFWSPAQARGVVHACEAAGIAVIGLEGFFVERGQVQALLEAIADFSSASRANWGSFVRGCSRDAQEVLADWEARYRGTSFMVTLTLLAKDDTYPYH